MLMQHSSIWVFCYNPFSSFGLFFLDYLIVRACQCELQCLCSCDMYVLCFKVHTTGTEICMVIAA